VIKKLDKLILRAFIGPFLATFLLAIFVLILQFFWLWLDDFVGKGLDLGTFLKVVMYVAASWVPVALPLAILLSTIMTFGNLGESYELVAIKSAGISLQRFMRPILVVSVIISGVAFLFNNNVIPVVNLKLNKLKYEIVYTKPAFDIKPGVFYDRIEGYVIKLGKKEEGGERIEQIVIYEKGNYLQDNLILADSGSMKVSNDKRYLEFNLKNGTRYEEKGMRNSTSTELTRIAFREYKKVFDISSFFRVKTNDSLFKDNYRMLSVRQLNKVIDSANKRNNKILSKINKEVPYTFQFPKWYDSGKLKPTSVVPKKTIKDVSKIIPDSVRLTVADLALAKLSGAKSGLDVLINDYKEKSRETRYFKLARQQKFSLSFACFVLFMIGAPLGSIIRKGGLGTPLVFAVIFFVIFHLLNTVGEKLVKEGVLGDFVGTWLPSLVLLPVGIFLTYKAMRDSQLFNKEYYYRVFKKFRAFINKKKLVEQETTV
jgi:lipopolysaccharide export system permease protein